MIGALIGAGASLLGGIINKPKRQSAEKNSRDSILGQAAGAREAAEKYGFNPLTLLGVSSAVGPSESSNYLGSAIADAGMILADGYSKRSEQFKQLESLKTENVKLQEKLRDATLRPVVGGIYAQRQQLPTIRQSMGGTYGNSSLPVSDRSGDLADPVSGGAALAGRPPVSPFNRPILQVPVRDLGGNPTTLAKPLADRLGLGSFDQMVVEDYETLYGDEGGQVVALPRLGDAISYSLSGQPTTPLFKRGKSSAADPKKRKSPTWLYDTYGAD